MASSKETTLTKSCWERIQRSLKEPKPRQTRQEIVEKNYQQQCKRLEDGKHQPRDLLFRKEARTQEREKHFNKLAAEEVEFKKQEKRAQLQLAKDKHFQQDPCVQRFNRALVAELVKKENGEFIEFRKKRDQIKREYLRIKEEELKDRQTEAWKVYQHREHQRRANDKALSEFHNKQCQEKKEQTKRERQKQKEERESLRIQDIIDVQNYDAKLAESKKRAEKVLLENEAVKHLTREMQVKKMAEEEEQRKCVQSEVELTMQRRQDIRAEIIKNRQTQIQNASEKLAVFKREQEVEKALVEEKVFENGVAELESKEAKRQKQETEKRAATKGQFEYIATQIREKEEKKKSEQQMQLKERQALFESDRRFPMEKKKIALRNKQYHLSFRDDNAALAAERRARQLESEKAEQEVEVKLRKSRQENSSSLKQYLKSEIALAKDNGLNIRPLLQVNVGSHGAFVNGGDPDLNYSPILPKGALPRGDPLPFLGTDQTRRVKRCQEIKSMNCPLPNKNINALPPLTGPTRRRYRVMEIQRNSSDMLTSPSPLTVKSIQLKPHKRNL